MNIDIYLTKTEKDTIYETMTKYKISMSTIADILITETYYVLTHYGIENDLNKILEEEYLYKDERIFWKHGTIRPKAYKKGTWHNVNIINKAKYTTNVLHIYVKKDIKQYATEEGAKIYYQRINKEMCKRKEQNWDYNNVVRNMTKAIRNNWKYYEKIINEEKLKHE